MAKTNESKKSALSFVGNSVNRFRSVSRFESNDVVSLKEPYINVHVPTIVDKTNFRPSAESVRAVLLSPQGVPKVQAMYDFMDGKDTGYRPFRDVGADIVDIQERIEAIKAEAEKVKDDKIKAQEYAEQIATLEKAIANGMLSAVNGTANGNADAVSVTK